MVVADAGEFVVVDRLFSTGGKDTGTVSGMNAMVIMDMATRWRDCFPSAEQDATQSRLALQSFIGTRTTVKTFQCVGAGEIYKAAVDLGIARPHLTRACLNPIQLSKEP